MARPTAPRITRADEEAGAREPFDDAVLYDHEYRRRREDVRFYRLLAAERRGPILDLGCGTGRLLVPLARDGHTVVGLDRASAMLAGAQQRLARLGRAPRARAHLIRADLRRFAFRSRFALALCAFHGVQHLMTTRDLQMFLRRTARVLLPGGWLAFDLFVPDHRWLARDPTRLWDRTLFRHPRTGQRTSYQVSHWTDRHRLLMQFHYRTIGADGHPRGPARVIRLCHRLWSVSELDAALTTAGFRVLARYTAFDGTLADAGHLTPEAPDSEQMIYVARKV